ncbi:MAG TPA: hypothetical protein P5565_03815, partial [Bacteroidia bacterium]|nr:hypothetical protein [Bacteroidia bacterium]
MKLFSWDNAVNPDRVELVFEHRNKEFGAYVLRSKYQRRILTAMLISFVAAIVFFLLPQLMTLLSSVKFNDKSTVTEVVTLAEPPPIDKSTPPPPPVIPPPPVQQTIKFTPPKVV